VPPLRFLLDQGFPKPPSGLAIDTLDKTAYYVHVSDHLPQLTRRTSTPDWILYLAASRDGFDAFVCRDLQQFEQREEMVTLFLTGLTMITWVRAIEDPVAEWGQLLAYGPQVVREMSRADYRPTIFKLPAPRLGSGQRTATRQRVQEMAAELRLSLPQFQSEAVGTMRRYLNSTRNRTQAALLRTLEDALARPMA
jgi:hypothetical protein